MKFIVEFNNGETTRVIAEVDTYQETSKVISDFLEERNYKSYYWRKWAIDNGKKIQVDVYIDLYFLSVVNCPFSPVV